MKSPFILLCSQFAAQSTVHCNGKKFPTVYSFFNDSLYTCVNPGFTRGSPFVVWRSDLPYKGVSGTLQLCNVPKFALNSPNFMESGDYRGSLYVNFHHMI